MLPNARTLRAELPADRSRNAMRGGIICREDLEARWVRRSSTGRHEKPLRELLLSQALVQSGYDTLAAAEYALASLMEFLASDQPIMDTGIAKQVRSVGFWVAMPRRKHKLPPINGEPDASHRQPSVPPKEINQLSRPATLRYRKLIAEFTRANEAAEAGDDELYVILKCVVSVILFLDADIEVLGAGLTRPLGVLAAALRDLGQGARPPLFFDRPKKGPGRPRDLSFEAARGAVAAAVAALIDWGEKREEAGKFLATWLEDLELKLPNGNPIGAKQVLRWRDEIGGSAAKLAEQTFRSVAAKYAAVPPEISNDPKRRRAVVVGALIAIRSEGF